MASATTPMRDTDGDGILDIDDEFPFDTDNDGINNNRDLDDDGDGVEDTLDAFPLDPTETQDSDDDGVGDVADPLFDDDASEWSDNDSDGTGDNADLDDDNDGVNDVDDAFPLDATESVDSDGDGYGDNSDQFPNNPLEWEDLDGDGLGDNYGISGFNSYRLSTDWFPAPSGILDLSFPETYSVGDFDKDTYDDIVVTNARFDHDRQPVFMVSSADLVALDNLDGATNHVIDLMRTLEERNSWEFGNPGILFRSAKFSAGVAGDLNEDDQDDFIITGPVDFNLTGSVYIVHGQDLASLDTADEETDGMIDYYQCVEDSDCTLLRSSGSTHAFRLHHDDASQCFWRGRSVFGHVYVQQPDPQQ